MGSRSYRDLIAWQKGMDLVEAIYELTENFPDSQRYSLSQQMQKAAVSIPSNLAEGSKRGTTNDFRHFVVIAYGSGAELETQLEIAMRLKYGRVEQHAKASALLSEVMRLLNGLANKSYKLKTTNYKLPPELHVV